MDQNLHGPLSEKLRYDLAWQPCRGIEARDGVKRGKAVRTADPLWGAQASAQPVADDRSHYLGLRAGESLHLAALARPPVADRHRPVVEQVAVKRDLVAATMVQLGIVGV
jgi:hypothetical protein